MKIVSVSLQDLKPYENNPRLNDNAVEAVMNSIKEFGFNVPLVIDKNNMIVAGHTRYKAANRLKLETVPCYRVENLTEEQIKAFRLADNKVSELAEWDFTKLEQELAEISLDMSLFSFELEELEEEQEEEEEPEVTTDTNYNYSEQYGVIVICKNEIEQEEVYNNLIEQGYECKVVAV